VVRFRRRIRILRELYMRGEMDWEEVAARLQAWNAHAAHGDTWKLREHIFSQNPFSRAGPGKNS
jgi:RNA-directed DNA polymerase